MKTPHERSVGAAMERKAFKAYLERQRSAHENILPDRVRTAVMIAFDLALVWVGTRQSRYDTRRGGLGKR